MTDDVPTMIGLMTAQLDEQKKTNALLAQILAEIAKKK